MPTDFVTPDRGPLTTPIPRRTYGICDVFDERALFDFIVWNAPDHEYSRRKPTPDDRVGELVKAGALIVAEIERLQRQRLDS